MNPSAQGKAPVLEIRYTRTSLASKEPIKRANPTDAGMDLVAAEGKVIPPGCRAMIGTGVCLELPEGYYGRVAPRSGLAHKHGIDVLAGVVDSGYRGEIKVILLNTDRDEEFRVEPGDRIAQMIVERHYNFDLVEVEDLTSTPRGRGGFGSTGV